VDAEKAAPEIAREAVDFPADTLCRGEQPRKFSVAERLQLRQPSRYPCWGLLHDKLLAWKEQLLPKHPMAEAVKQHARPVDGS